MSEEKKDKKSTIADDVLKFANGLLPGFQSFFKKAEQSKTFGDRMKKIREEIEKRFGKK